MIRTKKKILIITLFVITFFSSLMINMPAWMVSSILSNASKQRIELSNESGSFWHGSGMLLARDGKNSVPLMLVGWKIKLGWTKFINIDFTSAGVPIAQVSLSKAGVQVGNLQISLPLSSLTTFLGNLNSLNLSGNVHVSSKTIQVAKKLTGSVQVNLDAVGSGISPVNPIGSYQLAIDLSATSINVTSSGDSIISVDGAGNLNGLILKANVKPEKREHLLQFMTMMGLPQPDGSYQMKVF